MATRPTATVLLDGFLAARATSVAPQTLARDRDVLAWLRACVEAAALEPIDDLTAYLLSHSTGRLPTDRELAAVLLVVERVPEFFSRWLPLTVGASAEQTEHAELLLLVFGRWLLARRLVDEGICAHLARFTTLQAGRHDGPGEPQTSPRHS